MVYVSIYTYKCDHGVQIKFDSWSPAVIIITNKSFNPL